MYESCSLCLSNLNVMCQVRLTSHLRVFFVPVCLMLSLKVDKYSILTALSLCQEGNAGKQHWTCFESMWHTSFCCSDVAGLSEPKKYFLSRYLVAMWDDLSCLTAFSFWGVLLYCSRSNQHVRWILSRNTQVDKSNVISTITSAYCMHPENNSPHMLCMFMQPSFQFNANMTNVCISGSVME